MRKCSLSEIMLGVLDFMQARLTVRKQTKQQIRI